MPARVQGTILGLGVHKQADAVTVSSDFVRFRKNNATFASLTLPFENDSAEIGKGHEFSTDVFPTGWDFNTSIQKFASAEFCAWAFAYALGAVVKTGTTPSFIYTCTPFDVGVTLEPPYFSVTEQLAEAGAKAIDRLYYACMIRRLNYSFQMGAGRQNSQISVDIVGTGKYLEPSAVVIPVLQSEKILNAATMTMVINTVDYVAVASPVSGQVTIDNNPDPQEGYYPGSGLQTTGQLRGFIYVGPRRISCSFRVKLKATSAEMAKLLAKTTGTAVFTVTYSATASLSISFTSVAFTLVDNSDQNGLATVDVTVEPLYTTSILSVVAKCGLDGIAQA